MTEEHLPLFPSQSQLPNLSKRKRMPSKYAQQIADFKNNLTPPSKTTKTIKFAQPIQVPQEDHKNLQNKPLLCILPSGKKYSLRLVMGTNKQGKGDWSGRKKLKRAQSITSPTAKQQKKQQVSICLLDKFLSAFQNLQKEQENNESKQNHETSKQNKETKSTKEQRRVRPKEMEEKWGKYYQKYLLLSSKLGGLEETYAFLI